MLNIEVANIYTHFPGGRGCINIWEFNFFRNYGDIKLLQQLKTPDAPKLDNNLKHCWEGCEEIGNPIICCWQMYKLLQPLWGAIWQDLVERKILVRAVTPIPQGPKGSQNRETLPGAPGEKYWRMFVLFLL